MRNARAQVEGVTQTGRRALPASTWLLPLAALILCIVLVILSAVALTNLATEWTNDGLAADANQSAGSTSIGDLVLAFGCVVGCLAGVIGIVAFTLQLVRRIFIRAVSQGNSSA